VINSRHDVTACILSIDGLKSKGDLMTIDLYAKAVNLLEQIANSVHEREPKNQNLLFFSTTEVQLVQDWLAEFAKETSK
jgi:hypothetical protein